MARYERKDRLHQKAKDEEKVYEHPAPKFSVTLRPDSMKSS